LPPAVAPVELTNQRHPAGLAGVDVRPELFDLVLDVLERQLSELCCRG
jgi:hypothetical protein